MKKIFILCLATIISISSVLMTGCGKEPEVSEVLAPIDVNAEDPLIKIKEEEHQKWLETHDEITRKDYEVKDYSNITDSSQIEAGYIDINVTTNIENGLFIYSGESIPELHLQLEAITGEEISLDEDITTVTVPLSESEGKEFTVRIDKKRKTVVINVEKASVAWNVGGITNNTTIQEFKRISNFEAEDKSEKICWMSDPLESSENPAIKTQMTVLRKSNTVDTMTISYSGVSEM